MTEKQVGTNSQNIATDKRKNCKMVEMTVIEMNVYVSEYEAHRDDAEFVHKFETTKIGNQGLEEADIWLKNRHSSLSVNDSQLLKELIDNNPKATIHLDLDDDVVHVVIYHFCEN